MAAVLKAWRRIKNSTPEVDAYLFEEGSCPPAVAASAISR